MKETMHTEAQIIGVVNQMDSGRGVKDLAREMEVTDAVQLSRNTAALK